MSGGGPTEVEEYLQYLELDSKVQQAFTSGLKALDLTNRLESKENFRKMTEDELDRLVRFIKRGQGGWPAVGAQMEKDKKEISRKIKINVDDIKIYCGRRDPGADALRNADRLNAMWSMLNHMQNHYRGKIPVDVQATFYSLKKDRDEALKKSIDDKLWGSEGNHQWSKDIWVRFCSAWKTTDKTMQKQWPPLLAGLVGKITLEAQGAILAGTPEPEDASLLAELEGLVDEDEDEFPPAGGSTPPPSSPIAQEAQVEEVGGGLRAELVKLSLKELKKRARRLGAGEDAIDSVENKEEGIKLVLSLKPLAPVDDSAMRAELAALSLKELKKRARELGADDDAIDGVENQTLGIDLVLAMMAAAPVAAPVAEPSPVEEHRQGFMARRQRRNDEWKAAQLQARAEWDRSHSITSEELNPSSSSGLVATASSTPHEAAPVTEPVPEEQKEQKGIGGWWRQRREESQPASSLTTTDLLDEPYEEGLPTSHDIGDSLIEVVYIGSDLKEGRNKSDAYREYTYGVRMDGVEVKAFALRFSEALTIHEKLAAAVKASGGESGGDQLDLSSITFPNRSFDAFQDMTHNEENANRRGQELLKYYMDVFQRKDVIGSIAFSTCIGGTKLDGFDLDSLITFKSGGVGLGYGNLHLEAQTNNPSGGQSKKKKGKKGKKKKKKKGAVSGSSEAFAFDTTFGNPLSGVPTVGESQGVATFGEAQAAEPAAGPDSPSPVAKPTTLAEAAFAYGVSEDEIVGYSEDDLQELLISEMDLGATARKFIISEIEARKALLPTSTLPPIPTSTPSPLPTSTPPAIPTITPSPLVVPPVAAALPPPIPAALTIHTKKFTTKPGTAWKWDGVGEGGEEDERVIKIRPRPKKVSELVSKIKQEYGAADRDGVTLNIWYSDFDEWADLEDLDMRNLQDGVKIHVQHTPGAVPPAAANPYVPPGAAAPAPVPPAVPAFLPPVAVEPAIPLPPPRATFSVGRSSSPEEWPQPTPIIQRWTSLAELKGIIHGMRPDIPEDMTLGYWDKDFDEWALVDDISDLIPPEDATGWDPPKFRVYLDGKVGGGRMTRNRRKSKKKSYRKSKKKSYRKSKKKSYRKSKKKSYRKSKKKSYRKSKKKSYRKSKKKSSRRRYL